VLTSSPAGYHFTTNSTANRGLTSHHCLFTVLLALTGLQLQLMSNQIQSYITTGRAVFQAVSRRLPIATAGVQAQVNSCGIYGGQSGIGAGFLEYLDFPCQFSFHRLLYTHHLLILGWYNWPVIGRRTQWTQSHPTPRN
jgi:hypothetical protein